MSTVQAAAKWIEATSDFANAILVKETRQALKSRSFVVIFMLVLAASWAASVFGLVMQGNAIEFGAAGRSFFMVFFIVLSAAVLFVVPFGAYRSLLAERDQNTFELLSITTLSPRQIVWGKLLSAMVQVFLFYSAITPFIAFASLLQGFDVVTGAYLLVAALLMSFFFSTITVMLGSFAKHRASQAATSLVVLGALAYGLSGFLGMAFNMPVTVDDSKFWWTNAFVVLAGLSYVVLFQQIAISQLTFESDNRSTRIRMTCAAQFWLLWLAFIGYYLYKKTPWPVGQVELITTLSILHWSAVGLFAATEGDYLSHRVRRLRPKSRIVRFLVAPLLPGGARGYLFLILHLIALWFLSVSFIFAADRAAGGPSAGRTMKELFFGLFALTSDSWLPAVRATSIFCCYVAIYVGIGAMLSRWLRSVVADARSAHMRVLTFFVFGAGLIGPLLPRMVDSRAMRGYSLIQISNPFETYNAVYEGPIDFRRVMPVLLIATIIVLLLNLRAMYRGVREIVSDGPGHSVPSVTPSATSTSIPQTSA